MTTIERRVDHLEATVLEVLPSFDKRLQNLEEGQQRIEERLGHLETNLEQHIVMLGAFLKRRLDPDDKDEWRPE